MIKMGVLLALIAMTGAALAATSTPAEQVQVKISEGVGPFESYSLNKSAKGAVRLVRISGHETVVDKTLNVKSFDYVVEKYVRGVVGALPKEDPTKPRQHCASQATLSWKLAPGEATPNTGTRKVCLDERSGSGVQALVQVFHTMSLSD